MALQPAAGERAERHDRQALASRPVDGRGDQQAADAPALEFLGDLGVDEGQSFPVVVVPQFGEVAAEYRWVSDLTRQLVVDHRIAPAAFDEAQGRLGARGLVELTATIGYYAMIAATLNAFPDSIVSA